MIGAGDLVATGLVVSLAHPGSNITGLAALVPELTGKHVELLTDALPNLSRIAAVCNAPDPFSKRFLEQILRGGKALRVEIAPLMVTPRRELDAAFPVIVGQGIEAAIVQPSLPLRHAAELALQHRVAAVSPLETFAEAGGLMAYAGIPADTDRGAAVFVDKILKGAKPRRPPGRTADALPAGHQLEDGEALGLTIPPLLLARADEVID